MREGGSPNGRVAYSEHVESAVAAISDAMEGTYRLSHRSIALLLLQGDDEISELVRTTENGRHAQVMQVVDAARADAGRALDSEIVLALHAAARRLTDATVSVAKQGPASLAERLGRWCAEPITGVPILLLALWFGLYQFVGVFGGGTLVGWLEDGLFAAHINPWVTSLVERLVPWAWLSSLFVGEFGIWTLGVTYAAALILPIVGTFFLAFSVLEDSGYFPRLALLVDRLFKRIGLNGRAVIPIVLGFGCDTMATLVTRILETRRERLIATFLLALAIPCSAQLGVMTAMLAGHPGAFALWVAVMVAVFIVIGYLTAKLLPGEPAVFAIEVPPLRWPSIGNILIKTAARVQWYFREVVPLFVLASIVLWVGDLTGAFGAAVRGLHPMTHWLGLPPEAAEAFLFGFFRRDYGAAGLYRLQHTGVLSGNQLLVCVVTLTLFLPCVAQFLTTAKERGWRAAVAMAVFIFPFAIGVGALLNAALSAANIHL